MRLLIVSTILILTSWPTIAGPDYPFPEEFAELQGRAEASSKTAERLLAAAAATSASATAAAEVPSEAPPPDAVRNLSREELCEALASAAQANDLPVGFFVRLIWQESRFIATAVSRAGAQGVAQFMPAVAAEVGLSDPFDPLQALPKSAEFLRTLRRELGNLGLAAAAYNAGTGRIKSWLERRAKLPQQMRGRARLPKETHHYVTTITGHAPEYWINGSPENVDFATAARVPCRDEIEADQPPQVDMPVRVADASDSVPPPRARLQTLGASAGAGTRRPAEAACTASGGPAHRGRRAQALGRAARRQLVRDQGAGDVRTAAQEASSYSGQARAAGRARTACRQRARDEPHSDRARYPRGRRAAVFGAQERRRRLHGDAKLTRARRSVAARPASPIVTRSPACAQRPAMWRSKPTARKRSGSIPSHRCQRARSTNALV